MYDVASFKLTKVVFHMQAVVGVAGRATRAAFIQHQARRNNMADVAAKDGSQVSELDIISYSQVSEIE